MGGGRTIKVWALVGFVPALFALDMWVPVAKGLPTGIGEALGCSGIGNGPVLDGWTSLEPWLYRLDRARANIPVATDGFFAIVAQGHGLSPEQAQAELRLVVSDAGGDEVIGDVSLLRTWAEGTYLLGWAAREPLAVGAQLSASLGTAPGSKVNANVGGQFALLVEGEPTPLPLPELAFAGWGKYYHGTGDSVLCATKPGTCNAGVTTSVPGSVVEQVSAVVRWTQPAQLTGGVAWSVRVELGPEQAEAGTVAISREFLVYEPDEAQAGYLGSVVFPRRAERYCGTLVIEDLRTGRDRRAESCSAPGVLEEVATDTNLTLCKEPPTAALTPAWCGLHHAQPALCAEFAAAGDPTTEVAPASGSNDELGADSATTSRGCELSVARSAAPSSAALAGLVLGWLRRRRATRSR
jgi:hypothetical protein